MKQRLGIAAALLGEPELLILDEPTNGLDPAGIRDMRGLLRSIAADGPSVLVSSHLLAEVQQMCDWLVVVEEGRQVFQAAVALGIGIAWLMPLEHILQLSWAGAGRWFPGLSFDAVARGGDASVSFAHAAMVSIAYAVAAGVVALWLFVRRDVTA